MLPAHIHCVPDRFWWVGFIKNQVESISAILKHTSVSYVFLRNYIVHLQDNLLILKLLVQNLCDMACQNGAKSSFRKMFVYIT